MSEDPSSNEFEGVELSLCEKIFNILLCRGDLAAEKLETRPVSILQLFRFASTRDRVYVLVGCVLAVVIGVVQPLSCVISGLLANLFIVTKDFHDPSAHFLHKSYLHVLAFAVCFLILIIAAFVQNYFLSAATASIVRRLRSQFIAAVLRQDAEWFDHRDAGRITQQLNDNIDRIQDGLGDKVGLMLRGVAMFIASAAYAFACNWLTTLVFFGVGPMSALTMALMERCATRHITDMMSSCSDAAAVAEESIMNVKTVAACNGQHTMIKRYASRLASGVGSAMKMHFLNGFFEGFMFFELYVFYVAGVAQGVVTYYAQGESGGAGPGTIFVVVNTMLMGAYFLGLLGPHMMAILKARVAAAVIYKTIDGSTRVERALTSAPLIAVSGKLEFRDVHFTYPTRPTPILNGISWTAEAGETVAFVGHSGCGKSTSIGLLTRLYDANGGHVLLDGKDIQSLRITDLRKVIGIVQQEPCLFNGTIAENIKLGRADISDSRMEESARTANAHEFITKLEKGYDTLLGSGGVSLSGGQKQRIAIARAIAGDPKILLLDEATSALDTESEKIVQLALNKASRGRTTVIIAHRLSTLKDVQKIYVIDKGVVIETGSHCSLIAADGFYAQLAKSQAMRQLEVKENTDDIKQIQLPDRKKSSLEFHPTSLSARSSVRSLRDSTRSARSGIIMREKEPNDNGSKTSSHGLLSVYAECGVAWWQCALALTSSLLRGMEMPFLTCFMIFIFNALAATPTTYQHDLLVSCLVYFGLGLWCWVFIAAAAFFSGWSAELVMNSVREKVLRSLLHRDAAYFDFVETSAAACVSDLASHIPNMMAALDPRMVLISNNVVAVVGCLIFGLIFAWQIGLVILGMLIVHMWLQWLIQKKLGKELDNLHAVDKTGELAIEMVEQARTIQLLNVEHYFLTHYQHMQHRIEHVQNKIILLQSLTFAMLQSYIFLSDTITYSLGIYMIYYQGYDAGAIFVAASCANFCGWGQIFMAPSFNLLSRANRSAKSIFHLIKYPASVDPEEGSRPELLGNVNVDQLQFSYPTRPRLRVARGLSLSARRGEAIALVGASGCGKSTVIGILERFYTASAGTAKIDGHNIADMNKRHLRNNVALVGQEPVLFRGSVFENVSLGVESVSREEVAAACRTANAANFVEAFPLGYDTDVGEKGRNLSGGQKQRLAIARALIRQPRVLLLDEATSALDAESEKIVQSALNEAAAGRTSITIAHRLATIQNADRIYYIENGRVAECGSHEELLERNGKYAKLVAAQKMGHE